MALFFSFVLGRLWDAIGIAIAINRYSDWGGKNFGKLVPP